MGKREALSVIGYSLIVIGTADLLPRYLYLGSFPLRSTVTLTALPAMSLTPVAPLLLVNGYLPRRIGPSADKELGAESSVFTKTESPASLDRFAKAHGLPP
jgi:hypothetical protein